MKKSILFAVVMLIGLSAVYADFVDNPYIRFDADRDGTYVWFGGSSKVGKLSLSHDIIYYPHLNDFEAEIGPLFTIAGGKIDLLPMIGMYMNVTSGRMLYILPELYIYGRFGKWYLEGWNLVYLGVQKDNKDYPFLNSRYFLTYAVTGWLALGPHVEWTYDLSSDSNKRLRSLQVGGAFSFNYGKNNSFLVFTGVDTKADNRFVARFTFVHNF